jgi:hypothetical protein
MDAPARVRELRREVHGGDVRHPLKRRTPRKSRTPWRPKRSQESDMTRKSVKSPQKDELGHSEPESVPPNANIRKYPDEVYGDTEIPERKPRK